MKWLTFLHISALKILIQITALGRNTFWLGHQSITCQHAHCQSHLGEIYF